MAWRVDQADGQGVERWYEQGPFRVQPHRSPVRESLLSVKKMVIHIRNHFGLARHLSGLLFHVWTVQSQGCSDFQRLAPGLRLWEGQF